MKSVFLVIGYLVSLMIDLSLTEDSESLRDKEDRLTNQLKKKLPAVFPPDDIQNKEVVFSLGLKQIVEVDEKKNSWTISFEILIQYFSDSAKWDPEEYGGNEYIFLDDHSVWRPETALPSLIEMIGKISDRKQVLMYDGRVIAYDQDVTGVLSCLINVRKFPYDEQECRIRLMNRMPHRNWNVTVNPMIQEHFLSSYKDNFQWEVIKPMQFSIVKSYTQYEQTGVELTVRLKRRSIFYEFFLITPSLILYICSGFEFAIPVESGEKISFIVTILLAEMVNFGILQDIFPPSFDELPLLAEMIATQIIHIVTLSVIAIIVVHIYHSNIGLEMPAYLVKLISSKKLRCILIIPQEIPEKSNTIQPTEQSGKEEDGTQLNDNGARQLQQELEKFCKDEGTSSDDARDRLRDSQWKKMSAVIDRIMLIGHFIVVTVVILYFLIMYQID